MKRKLLVILYGIGLTAFTVYISLDTFVLSSTYKANATEMNTAVFDTVKVESPDTTDTGESNSNDKTATDESSDSSKTQTDDTDKEESSDNSEKRHRPGNKPGRSPGSKKGSSSENTKKNTDTDNSSSDNTENTPESDTETAKQSTTITESSDSEKTYKDDNISISLKTYNCNGTAVYVADVQLSSAEYLKTAFANDTYGKNVTQKTSEMAEEHNAILAINGDYYGVQENGYVIRNGVVYRDTASDNDVLCIYADGSFKVISASEASADELVNQGVWQAFSFGPGLIENGSVTVSQNDEVGKAMSSNPRTAIGIIDDLHYVFVVSDGRTDESEGLSLYELATFMDSLGVQTAYNLDGGGSSTMVFQGELINNPTTTGNSIKERGVSDIVYIG